MKKKRNTWEARNAKRICYLRFVNQVRREAAAAADKTIFTSHLVQADFHFHEWQLFSSTDLLAKNSCGPKDFLLFLSWQSENSLSLSLTSHAKINSIKELFEEEERMKSLRYLDLCLLDWCVDVVAREDILLSRVTLRLIFSAGFVPTIAITFVCFFKFYPTPEIISRLCFSLSFFFT